MTLIFNTRPAMVMNHARAKKIELKDQVMQQLRVETVGLTDEKTDGADFYRATLCQCGIRCRRVSVRLSVRPSQAGIVSKRLERSSCFGRGVFRPPIPHCVIRKFGYLQKFVPNSGLGKFRPRCQEKSSTSQYTAASVPISAAEQRRTQQSRYRPYRTTDALESSEPEATVRSSVSQSVHLIV